MGGSGGNIERHITGQADPQEALLRLTHAAFESSINQLLQRERPSASINDEEPSDTRLEAIKRALMSGMGDLTLQRLGTSIGNPGDIDVIVVFATAHISQTPPFEVLSTMATILRETILLDDDVESVHEERFQVIVKYRDNTGFRLASVISTDDGFFIPSPDSRSWVQMSSP